MKLSDLNNEQLKAVKATKGPVLVFAGAGSGKTRVLTYKVWYLIKNKIYSPNEILALTFTNKAASEMKERINTSVSCDGVAVGTFHSVGARILRKHIQHLDERYSNSFTIYDESDQKSILKEIIEELDLSDYKEFHPNILKSRIDNFKNSSMSVKDVQSQTNGFENEKISEIYNLYLEKLINNNAVDFNDLILLPIVLFKKNKKILSSYQNLWKYILVDEFQDTNSSQFEFISFLGSGHKNITVVGDDDQSIYGWRGANIDNILTNFKKVFPKANEIKLEKNYRSSQRILDAAWSVVSNNTNRAEKQLVATKGKGDKISLISASNDEQEALAIADSIKKDIKVNKSTFQDFAILYRTNAQSRMIEQILMREGIPYNIVGGTKFYDRKEIKNVIAYLTLICNPNDDIALKRIINFPVRGLGEKSIKLFQDLAKEKKISLFKSLEFSNELKLRNKQCETINNFYNSINGFHELLEKLDSKELFRVVLEEFSIEYYYKNNPLEQDRYNNIQELKSSIDHFAQNSDGGLKEFLQEISLYTDLDDWNNKQNSVTLMTVHAAKGLEFPTVFITGLEQGLFPLIRIDDTNDQLEEERRLFYVALTRAMEKAYLLNAHQRRRFGAQNISSFVQSDFLNEIDENTLKINKYKSVYTKRIVNSANGKSVKVSRTVTEFDDFSVGDMVQHNLFGVGTIIVLSGSGENQKVGIEFKDGLKKKLIVKYANLKRID